MVVGIDHPSAGPTRMVGSPLRVDGSPARATATPPTLGQHSREILIGLGADEGEVDRLVQAGAVHVS